MLSPFPPVQENLHNYIICVCVYTYAYLHEHTYICIHIHWCSHITYLSQSPYCFSCPKKSRKICTVVACFKACCVHQHTHTCTLTHAPLHTAAYADGR